MTDTNNNGTPPDNGGDDSVRAAAEDAFQEIFSGAVSPKQAKENLDPAVNRVLDQMFAEMTSPEALQGIEDLYNKMYEYKRRYQALSEENRALRERVAYDDLTGLLKPKVFEDRIEEAIAILQRDAVDHDRDAMAQAWDGGNIKYCLAFIDMDSLKWINDTYGHKAGNKAIQTLAGRLRDELRPTDSAARLGGDEFAVLIKLNPGDDIQSARKRLKALLSDISIDHEGRIPPVSASIGCHRLNTKDSPEQQLDEADGDMYSTKKKSRQNGPGL